MLLKKTITYTDFNGQERTEDFYFGLTKADMVEMENSMNGGLTALLEQIVRERNQSQIISYFKEIVLKSYGVKSLDGRNFVKNDEVRAEFASTMAYSKIFMELATNSDAAMAFVRGIMPDDIARKDSGSPVPSLALVDPAEDRQAEDRQG